MKLFFRTLILFTIGVIITLYYSGCSSAEQTTARLAYAQGDYEKAANESLKETQSNPSNDEAWGYLAMSRIQLNKVADAKDAYTHYMSLGKNSLEKEFNELFYERYKLGYDSYSDTMAKDPNKIKGNLQTALQYFDEAQIVHPDTIFVLRSIAYTQAKLGMSDDALANFDKILAKNKNDTAAVIAEVSIIHTNAQNSVQNYVQNRAFDEKRFDNICKQLEPIVNSPLIANNNLIYSITNSDLGQIYYCWADTIKSIPNSDTSSYLDKYRKAQHYLETALASLENDSSLNAKSIKLADYTIIAFVYGSLGMSEKGQDALDKRKKLKEELQPK